MAKRTIIIAPDPRLKLTCAPVERVDATARALFDDMLETMYAAPGVGLAAPQIGVTKRMLVVDVADKDAPRAPLCLANPEILWASDEVVRAEEGCLSFPDHYAEVTRPARVRVRFLDYEDEIREIEADGLLARCLQHEIDHLDGIVFVDHISTLKRGIILRKLQKAQRMERQASA